MPADARSCRSASYSLICRFPVGVNVADTMSPRLVLLGATLVGRSTASEQGHLVEDRVFAKDPIHVPISPSPAAIAE